MNPKSTSTKALSYKFRRRLEQRYVEIFNKKLADPASSSFKM